MGKQRQKWEENNMKEAVEKVRNKEMTIREASERYSVPKSTLGDKVKSYAEGKEVEIKPCLGNVKFFPRTFNDEQEMFLYNHIKSLDSHLMPLNREEFLKLVYQYAEKLKIKHRFNKTKQKAGKDFYYDFMKRYNDLRLRSAESTSLQRAAGFSKEQVSRFFEKLTELMDKYNFSPSKIFNSDETGVSCVHTNKLKVMSVKGKKQVGKLTSGERGRNVTIVLTINASGDQFIPPLFVFPRVRLDNELKKDAPLGSIFDGQPSGWITAEGFLKWMKMFAERVNPSEKDPVLLIVDGHSTHKDLSVITFAKEHHIHMLSLPPHTSHKLQPLDRVIMKPFKNAYNEACSLWMRKYPNIKIALKDIAGLVNIAFSRICRMELAQSGFKCTGICPLNPTVFGDLDYTPSLSKADQSQNNSKSIITTEDSASTSTMILSLPGPSKPVTDEQMVKIPVVLENDSATSSLVEDSLNTTSSQNILEEISPLPSSSNTKFISRQSRGEKSDILTSTPYKEELERKKGNKEERERILTAKRKLLEENLLNKEKKRKKIVNKLVLVKRSNSIKNKIQSKMELKSEDEKGEGDEETHCIICGETFEEDWIQSGTCKGWAHENCADLEENSLFYECDVCFSKKK